MAPGEPAGSLGAGRPGPRLAPAVLLAFALAGVAAAAPAQGVRLSGEVVPRFQAIHLTLDAGVARYSGSVRIELEVLRAAESFALHAEGLEVETLTLERRTEEGDRAVAVEHSREGEDLLRVTAAAPLEPGHYVLAAGFANEFDTQAQSLYRMEAGGHGYAFTQFEAIDARGAFPCFDEPSFKIPYQMTLTVPEGHLAVSNTPVEEERVEAGWRTTVFQRTRPLPSYLLALATGPLESVEMTGLAVPARVVTVKGQSHLARLAIEMTPPILAALEAYFGRPYPYEKLDFIGVPEFWPGAMENPGAVTFSDVILLPDPERATVGERRRLALVIAHELAHQWFGNLVTMAWWDDLWLNESFADWMGDRIVQRLFPEFQHRLSAVQDAQRIMGLDARTTTVPVRRPVENPADLLGDVGLAYNKGKAVLGMFERWLGEGAFRRGVVAYLEAHVDANAEAADLWRALDNASEQPVAAAMATFIEQPGLPLVEAEPLEEGRLRLAQRRFRNHGASSPDHVWKIPVALAFLTENGVETRTLLLDEPARTVDLGTGSAVPWVYLNAGAGGYYRWSVPGGALDRLLDTAAGSLEPAERVELLGNLSALLDSGELGGGRYLDALGRFLADPEPLVVSAALEALGDVKTAFVADGLEPAFAAYLRRALRPAVERFGLERRQGEAEPVSLLRPRLLEWLGDEGDDPGVQQHAGRLAARYLEDPSSVDPALASAALRLAAIGGDRQLFDTLRQRFETAEEPGDRRRFLQALSYFRQPELAAEALAYALEGPVRPNEIFQAVQGQFGDDAARERSYRWLTGHYDRLMERIPPVIRVFMPYFASGCSLERLQSAQSFFSRPEHSPPGTETQLARVAEQVRDCVSLRQREGGGVAEFLRRAEAGS